MQLPDAIAHATAPVFDALPLEQAMPELVPSGDASAPVLEAVKHAVSDPTLADYPGLRAGLWLYADALDASHDISQAMPDPTGSYWHAIMHRREGDFSNSKYWYRQAGDHPAIQAVPDTPGFDPFAFVDRVAADDGGATHAELVTLQRQEWATLFQWCASHPG
ncbi:MAG: hypothetical protein AAGI68_07720 [Planctomycetota bacterium]